MALQKVPIQPGIVTEDTDYTSEGRWTDGNLVRFRRGRPESIKGWASTGFTVTGVPRAIEAWQQLNGFKNVAFGSNSALMILQEDALSDITPIRRSLNDEATALTTTSGSSVVSVADTGHGAEVGDRVIFSDASGAVGGLTIDGEYIVTEVTDANNWKFDAGSNATSSTTGPATIDIDYLVTVGEISSLAGFGWGAGPWGEGTWGTPRTATDIILELLLWSLGTWGEDLVACPRGGSIYLWDATNGVSTRAVIIHANAPTANRFIRVAGQFRQIFAYGTETTIGDPTTLDPLFVRWCTREDYSDWAPTSTNTAGSYRLSSGSKIVAEVQSRREALIWTDTSLWVRQWIGGEYQYSFDEVAREIEGPAGQNAVIDIQGVAYWMGPGNFWRYDGQIHPLDCPVHGFVFDNLNVTQGDKVIAGHVEAETEIWWFYQDNTGTEVNRVVVFNYREETWWIGALERTVWKDKSIFTVPLATDPTGLLFEHETGHTANGSEIEWYLESGDADISDGDEVMLGQSVVPDLGVQDGQVHLTLKARAYPNATQESFGPHEVTDSTGRIDFFFRGRQVALRIESASIGARFRAGTFRADIQPDGEH